MNQRIFIHAPNVHQGGGLILLEALVKSIGFKFYLTIDERNQMAGKLSENVDVKIVPRSISGRLLVEKWLVKNVEKSDLVICFGNLPPLFRLKGSVVVFLQNRYLVDDLRLDGFSLLTKFRLTIEKIWFRGKLRNAQEIYVQTESMKRLIHRNHYCVIPVTVLPFLGNSGFSVEPCSARQNGVRIGESEEKKYDFVYVATGEPHKNHILLIEAWSILASEGIFPSLAVTLDSTKNTELCNKLDKSRDRFKLKIHNLGFVNRADIVRLYSQSRAAIYPSQFESFGLPLVEAERSGLPILASERDYVRDLIKPTETFDPTSAVSIARSVKRYLGFGQNRMQILNPSQFIQFIMNKYSI